MEEHRELLAASAAPLQMVVAYGGQKFRADTDSLPFGHDHQPRGPISSSRKQRSNGQVANRFSIDETDKLLGGYRSWKV